MEPVYSALIVDDNEFNRKIFRIAFETAGYQSTHACNGMEALIILETERFNVIELDLQMPLIACAVVLKNLYSNPARAGMIVIVATANPHMAVGEVESLADYMLYKPINLHEFAVLVERLKDRSLRPLQK